MDFPEAWGFLPSAWVCANFLSGSGQEATDELREVVEALAVRPDIVTRRRRERMVFKALLSKKRSGAVVFSSPVLSRLQNLPEPERSALLLMHLTEWDVSVIADFLEIPRSRIPRLLFDARRSLESLDSVDPSKEVLSIAARRYSEAESATGNTRGKNADDSAAQSRLVLQQIEVDRKIHEDLLACLPSEAVVADLKASIQPSRRIFPGWRDPAFWAVAIGIVLLAGVLVWNAVGSPPDLPPEFGEAIEKIELAGPPSPMSIPSTGWDDWLLLGDLEGFSLPPGFPAQGVRAAGIVQTGGGVAAVLDLPDISARVVALRSSQPASPSFDDGWKPALRDSGELVLARRHRDWVFVAWAPIPLPELVKKLDTP